MTVSKDLAAAFAELEGRDLRRVNAAHPVWDLRDPGLLSRNQRNRRSQVAACRAAIWRALFSSGPQVFLRHHEPPSEYDVPGAWHAERMHTWRVPADFDPNEASTSWWLLLGGWMAYAAERVAEDPESLFDMTPERMKRWADRYGVALAVESFWDDVEWRVLAPGEWGSGDAEQSA